MNTSSEAADISPAKPRKWVSLALGLSLPLALLLKMGLFFLVIGMIPTFIVMAVMRHPGGYVISTVAAFNFTGVFPDLLGICMQGSTPRAFADKLSDMGVWYSMYGSALLGLAVVWLSPAIAMFFLESVYRSRLRHMENLQKKLEEEWGAPVKGRTAEE